MESAWRLPSVTHDEGLEAVRATGRGVRRGATAEMVARARNVPVKVVATEESANMECFNARVGSGRQGDAE